MSNPIRFVRRDLSDGAIEILTIVRVEGREDYFVEVCAGPNVGDDFVGLYDLEGDKVDLGNVEWEAADGRGAADDALVAAVEDNFANGNVTVERVEEADDLVYEVQGYDGHVWSWGQVASGCAHRSALHGTEAEALDAIESLVECGADRSNLRVVPVKAGAS